MKTKSLLQYLDEYLQVSGYPDYPTALNGLQVQGPDEVSKVVTAVDASAASIDAAVAAGADLMIVHHGLFWGGLEPLVGRNHRRVAALLKGDVGLYSCHLPLDAHAEVGNCALLARALGLDLEDRFGSFQGMPLGWRGRLPAAMTPDDFRDLVSGAVGGSTVRALPGGPERIETVAVLTGGGGSFVREAAEAGVDAFVTGEGSHHSFFDAADFGIHVLFAGHYATETFGVRALGEHISDRFDVAAEFIDQPTRL